jgi:tryptophanyl-tRNA synthetase
MKSSVFKSKSPLLSKTPNKRIITCKEQKMSSSKGEKKHFSIEMDKETGKKVFKPVVGGSTGKDVSLGSSVSDMAKTQKKVLNPNFYQYHTPVKPSGKSFTARNEVKSKLMAKIS